MQAAGTKKPGQGIRLSKPGNKKPVMRKLLEAGGWVLIVSVLWATDLLVKMSERDQAGFGKDDFRLVSEQVTSGIAVLIMILFVLRWIRLFPLTRENWVQAVIGHTAGSIFFAFGHQVLMIAMRIPWYVINGHEYIWRNSFVSNLITEYQKDIKIYLGIIVVMSAYQLYRRSRSTTVPEGSGRLLVQTGSGEAILRFEDIDYLEASKNYVAIHAAGREYLVRDTMANQSAKLPESGFVRTHRSFIVNFDRIREIRSEDSRYRVILNDGTEIPLSRSYREELKSRFPA